MRAASALRSPEAGAAPRARRALSLLELGLLLGAALFALGFHVWLPSTAPSEEDWRAAAAYVDTSRAESDHLTVTTDWLTLVSGYYMKSRPDSRAIRGAVTWVVTIPADRYRVEQDIRARGYDIRVKKHFPGVVVLKAVRPLA